MNYKNIAFKNSLSEFKRWCNEFEPLVRGTNVEFFKNGNFYMSLEKVKMISKEGFVGVTFRRYDEKEKDFVISDDVEAKLAFRKDLEDYKKRHNITIGDF